MKRILITLALAVPILALAGGYQVNLQGTKQTGMGHLGTSFYLGASSTYFNPAMMGLDSNKFSIEAGASFINSVVSYQNQITGGIEDTDNPLGTPFYLYATYKINDKFSAGLGVYTPFGSSVDWGKYWSGKQLIQDISLTAIFIQPTLSYNLNDKVRIGGGLNVVLGSVELNRNLGGPIGNNNTVNLEGSTTAFGFTTGIHYDFNDQLSFGLTYKSQVDVELEGGDANFDVHPALENAGVRNTEFDASLPLPSMTTLGVAYKATEQLLVSAEVSFIGWEAYESLDFDFKDNSAALEDSKNPRNYENSFIYRLGLQYTLNNLDLRIGGYYDQSPIQDDFFSPETPNSDNIGLTAGLSYTLGNNFGVDASILYIIGQERESFYTNEDGGTFGGNYASRSVIPGIGLNYKF